MAQDHREGRGDLFSRVTAFLARLECGLREIEGGYEVFNLGDGRVLTRIADLEEFARANGVKWANARNT